MNRRQFITGSAVASAAIMSGASALAQGTLSFRGGPRPGGAPANGGNRRPGGGAMIRKAVNVGIISEGETVLDKFKIAKDCGLDGLEVGAPTSDENLKELIAARDETGLSIAGIMFAGNWSQSLAVSDPEVRKTTAAAVIKALEQGKELGAPHVLLVPGKVDANLDYQTAWTNSVNELAKLAPIAEANRVKIGVENVWNNFLISPVEMAYYLDQINNPWVGCLFDIGNILRYGWPEHWIRTLNRRLVNLHIKGYDSKKANKEGIWAGFNVEMQDEGDFDWKPVARALVDIRYRGWLIAEVGGGKADRIQDISNRLQKMLDLAAAEMPAPAVQ